MKEETLSKQRLKDLKVERLPIGKIINEYKRDQVAYDDPENRWLSYSLKKMKYIFFEVENKTKIDLMQTMNF